MGLNILTASHPGGEKFGFLDPFVLLQYPFLVETSEDDVKGIPRTELYVVWWQTLSFVGQLL